MLFPRWFRKMFGILRHASVGSHDSHLPEQSETASGAVAVAVSDARDDSSDDRASSDWGREPSDVDPVSGPDRIVHGYPSGFEYLHDELARVALLVKAYVIRRTAAAESGPSPLNVVTQVPFNWEHLPTEAKWCRSWRDQLHEATELQRHISERLGKTPPEVSRRFRLTRLRRILKEDTDRHVPGEECLRLVSLQRDVLLVAFLDYHVAVYRSTFGQLHLDDGTKPGGLTVAMAAEICQPTPAPGDDPLNLFQRDVPLLRDRYVEVGDPGVEASRRRLQIDPAIAGFLLEAADDDPQLQRLVTRHDAPFPLDQLLVDESTLKPLVALSHRIKGTTAVVLFHGPAGGPYVSAAAGVLSSASHTSLLVADVARSATLPNWTDWTDRVYRQARLHGAAILWNGATAIVEATRTDARWQQLIRARRDMPVFISAEAAWDPDGVSTPPMETFVRIEFPIPGREVRRRIWQAQLEAANIALPPAQVGVTLDLLASFQFTEGQVSDAIMIARGLTLTDIAKVPDLSGHLYDACRRVSARGLISFTQRIPPRKFSRDMNPLDAVILAPEGRQQLQELNDRIENMNRGYYEYGFGSSLCLGRGLIALFSGPSGTGKTLAATVLASCRERDLYKVDMSAVVSKYVGETEKNLARVFSDAQSANALLFFDEADAIFGKRGEIDKAQDRWANMEINYLLQRVEEFAGVVILATNLKQNIDEAFLRRVQVLIDFKTPDAKDRQKILAAMFPADVVPPDAEDLKSFSEQFELTGGNLKNVAVDAAFRALHDQRTETQGNAHRQLHVTIQHLVLAAAREYRKLSRPVTVASFGRRFFEIVKRELRLD